MSSNILDRLTQRFSQSPKGREVLAEIEKEAEAETLSKRAAAVARHMAAEEALETATREIGAREAALYAEFHAQLAERLRIDRGLQECNVARMEAGRRHTAELRETTPVLLETADPAIEAFALEMEHQLAGLSGPSSRDYPPDYATALRYAANQARDLKLNPAANVAETLAAIRATVERAAIPVPAPRRVG